jgi:hypothetical protein
MSSAASELTIENARVIAAEEQRGIGEAPRNTREHFQ